MNVRTRHVPILVVAAGLWCAPVRGEVQFTGSYTQDFQVMTPTGTATPVNWFVGGLSGVDGAVDASGNGAITGTTVQVDDGSTAAGSGTIGHYNYGTSGNASRSLGSIATTSRGHRAMELRLDNRTGYSIASFEVRYDGKQWRLDTGGVQTLVLRYGTNGINFVDMGSGFNFNSPQTGGTGTAINGDSVRTNNIGGVYTPASPIPPGGKFYLRWFDFNDAGVADHGLAIDNVNVFNAAPAGGTILTFQQGVNGYSSVSDTWIAQGQPTLDNATAVTLEWDGLDAGGEVHGLLRFANIYGTNAEQIAPTDAVTAATLVYEVTNVGNTGTVNEVAVDWAPPDPVTWNTFGGEPGVQADEYGTQVGSAPGSLGTQTLDVTASVYAWSANPTANRGWIFRPTGGTDGVQAQSSDSATTASRPKLIVWVNGGSPAPKQLVIKHPPYLQLGNAPLVNTGPGIGATDQILIMWQTVQTGLVGTADDYFEVEYRPTGPGSYTSAGGVQTLNTGVETRVNHWATINGLAYNADYEYRVHHKRNPTSPVLVNTYTGAFHTRLAAAHNPAFRFAAYGDSAYISSPSELAQFESVTSRLAAMQAAFVMLLGDNVYNNGTHADLDGRFDATVVPINSAFVRNHIEYLCLGNHDSYDNAGQASLDDYAVPIPQLGVTSPVAPPAGETPEKNYSFDYGLVHFTVIDTCAWGDPGASASRRSAIRAWMIADLNASAQRWKIVVGHHPPKSAFGHSDTPNNMAADLIPALVQHGVDLLLVGHSHNFQRSFPLIGYSGSNVTYLTDNSGIYAQGGQVIQVIAGTGGRNIDGTAPAAPTEWLAKAYGINNSGTVGPLMVDASAAELRVRYVSAATGATKDEFVIVAAIRPDFDRDGDVDLTDWAHAQLCLSGSGVPQTDPACLNVRMDADRDVDDLDLAVVRNCLSGAQIPANPTCDD